MKLFGYKKGDETATAPFELKETTIIAKPKVLRQIAKMLNESADTIEKDFLGHLHLQDYWEEWKEEYPDFIVAQEEDNR